MTAESPIQTNRCKDCNQRKVVTRTGDYSFEVQCGCTTIPVTTTVALPEW